MQRDERDYSHLHPLEKIVVKNEHSERLKQVWYKLSTKCPEVFCDQTKGDGAYYIMVLTTPGSVHFYWGDKGVVSVMDILPKSSASVHIAFWEPVEVKEKIEVLQRLFTWLFKEFQLNRLTVAIPEFAKGAKGLALLMGFRFEGALRKGILYEGRYFDTQLYGLLRSDFEQGARTAVN